MLSVRSASDTSSNNAAIFFLNFESPQREEEDNSLENAARKEREYVIERLREELKREPTEDEVNEWLREQTEGY
ncbi:MAG TPA: hypothetical protein VK619_05050 [Pyrinomonadaceae bacterium]|nr:hypothetical protein [Pyrinomonadaceae bacterium]